MCAILCGCSTVKDEVKYKLLEKQNCFNPAKKLASSSNGNVQYMSDNMSPTILNNNFASMATSYGLRKPVSFKMQKVYLDLQWY